MKKLIIYPRTLLPQPGPFRAFTLIEVLAVIAVVGVLAVLSLAGVRSFRQKANNLVSLTQLRSIAAAATVYANDHRGFPPSTRFTVELVPYLDYSISDIPQPGGIQEKIVFWSPLDSRVPAWKAEGIFNNLRVSYASNNILLGLPTEPNGRGSICWFEAKYNLLSVQQPSKVFFFLDSTLYYCTPSSRNAVARHNGRVNVVFVDGHTESVPFSTPDDITKFYALKNWTP